MPTTGTTVRGAIGENTRIKKQVLAESSIDELIVEQHCLVADHLVNDMILRYDFCIENTVIISPVEKAVYFKKNDQTVSLISMSMAIRSFFFYCNAFINF